MRIGGHTDEPRNTPSDHRRSVYTETFLHQRPKLTSMLVEPEGIDPPVIPDADWILRRQELSAEQLDEMALHKALQGSFPREKYSQCLWTAAPRGTTGKRYLRLCGGRAYSDGGSWPPF